MKHSINDLSRMIEVGDDLARNHELKLPENGDSTTGRQGRSIDGE